MSLDLDDRHRAMLEEMGVPVWEPRSEAVAAVVAVAAVEPASVRTPPAAPSVRAELPLAKSVTSVPTSLETDGLDWDQLEHAVAESLGVDVSQASRNAVFGVGNRAANWMIVGEAPSDNEDIQGDPVVGQAGKLLDNMLRAIGLDRDQVFMANVLKRAEGSPNCEPFLRRQIELVRPKVILAMGRFAAQSLLADSAPQLAQLPLGKLRGQVHSFQIGGNQIPVVVTYHPAYLLRSLTEKPKAWADLCLALAAFQ